MRIYLTGVFVAFFIGLIHIIVILSTLSSTKNKNLNKIGLYYNPTISNYTKEKPKLWKSILYNIVVGLLVEPLLSWISVGFSIFSYLKALINKVPAPEKIKEINFKLSSVDLPKEEVKKHMNELAKFYGGSDISDFDDYDDDIYVLEEEDDEYGWYREIRLNRRDKEYTMYARTQDYDSQFTDIIEYKFIDNNLWIRTIEDKSEHMGDKEYWDIKDNVVLEHDVRSRMEKNVWNKPEDIEKKISSLKEDVEWRECKINQIKYFIMSRHSDFFTEFELRKYFRLEFERINNGYKNLEDEINRLGGLITKLNLFPDGKGKLFKAIKFREGLSEGEKEKVNKLVDEENLKQYGISYYEYEKIDDIRKDLERYLAILSGFKQNETTSQNEKGHTTPIDKRINLKKIMIIIVALSIFYIIVAGINNYQNKKESQKQETQKQEEQRQRQIEKKQAIQNKEALIEQELKSCKDDCFATHESGDSNAMLCVDICEQSAMIQRAEIKQMKTEQY